MSETLHVVALPHTETTASYATCAYTQRVVKFCRMMVGRGRRVILYGPERNEAPCDEHVVVVPSERRERWFGGHDENDISRGGFDWEPSSPWWSETNARAIGAIAERAEPTDIVCLSAGESQRLIADALPWLTVAEVMVGYEGIIRGRRNCFAAYESHTHRHLVAGKWGMQVARPYDVVIPNQFDPAELPFGPGDGGYLLYVGRMIGQKGVADVPGPVADTLGMPLVMAGPGARQVDDNLVLTDDGFEVRANDLTYVGAVGIEERARLMGRAAAVLVPTLYCEPFGGVAVEAMMCGTPVVATDWGAFTETVCEGVSGFRFNTVQEAVDATGRALRLSRDDVAAWASRYSLDAVRPAYEAWFARLDSLWTAGYAHVRQLETA